MLKKKGFTLIELLVVIAIIGLLASIVMVAMNNVRAKARDTQRIATLKQMQLAIEMYYDDNGSYPLPCLGSFVWSGHCPDYGNCDTNYIVGLVPNYAPRLPIDPRWDTDSYGYVYLSDGVGYMLLAHVAMETVCDGVDADTTADPGDECNPNNIQQMDRISYEQPTTAVYSNGAANW